MTGDGHAMAYRAGAMIVAADQLGGATGAGLGLPTYGTGQAANTWSGTPMVDANGKEIPCVDRNGNILERNLRIVSCRLRILPPYWTAAAWPVTIRNTGRTAPCGLRKKTGSEYVRPFYADLTLMPEKERRACSAIWWRRKAER